MDPKAVTQSVDEATKALKSSLTEGSSKLFGSVMDAKRGLFGGITSTFDHVVNIVGGPDDGSKAAAATANSGAESTGASKPRPPKPPAPVSRQRSDADFNGSVRQFADKDVGTSSSSSSSSTRMSRQNTAPSGYGGQPSVSGRSEAPSGGGSAGETTGRPPLDSKPPFKRRNTNPFMEGYDPNVVENEIPPPTVTSSTTVDGATVVPAYQSVEPSRAWDNMAARGDPAAGIPRIPSGEPSAFLAPGLRDSSSGVGRATRHRGGDDSDADSDATEGCDERPDDEELGEGGMQTGDNRSEPASRNSEQSWTNDAEDLSQLDAATKDCIEFMKYFVNKIIDPASEVTSSDKAKFGEMCQVRYQQFFIGPHVSCGHVMRQIKQGNGRLWFAKLINAQRANNKALPESVVLTLVQFIAIVLFECNEAEDYGPAKTLMNLAFTFYHEVQDAKAGPELNIFNKLRSLVGQSKRKTYLYTYLKDQAIWQSPRFWNAAFFFAVQQERASKPTASCNVQNREQSNEVQQQENLAAGQLRSFTSNMRALGVPKDHCLEFIRRQATLANLPNAQIKLLRDNMEQWTEEAVNK